MKKVLIFLICLIGYQIGCHAQMADEHYYFKNLSVQNGLSQNTVNAILQGLYVVRHEDGLNRYDGLSFANSNTMTAHGGALVIILSQLFMRTQKEISG